MEYDKGLVTKAGETYRDYLIANWRPGNKTNIMPQRAYSKLKREAFAHVLKVMPQARFPYAEWRKLMAQHKPAKAHKYVVNTSQETGRRLFIGLSQYAKNQVLNDTNRVVMRPDGTLMGRSKRKAVEPATEPTPVPVKQEAKQPAAPTLEQLKWRLLDCAVHSGTVPNAMGLAALLDISHEDAESLLVWLERITKLDSYAGGGYKVKPKQIDVHKLLELFHNRDRNPFELRALEVLLEVLSE